MTDRATPSPHIVLELLDDAGVLQDPALVRGLQDIAALGAGPAPQASAELARLMADGGTPQQGRRTKNRITFIGGALAVSMGVGISGVAAGTLHLTDGLGTAVDSASRFRAADAADSSGAERSEASSVVAPAAVTPSAPPIAPVPSPSAVPAPPGGAEEAAAAPAAGIAHVAPPASDPQPGQVTPAAPQSATTPGPVEAPAPAAPAVGAPPTPVEGPGTVPGSPVGPGQRPGLTEEVKGQGQAEQAKGGQGRSRSQGAAEQVQGDQGRSGQREPGRAHGQQDTARTQGGSAPDGRGGQAEDSSASPADRTVSWLRVAVPLQEDPVFLSAPERADDVWMTLFLADAEVVVSDDTTDGTADGPVTFETVEPPVTSWNQGPGQPDDDAPALGEHRVPAGGDVDHALDPPAHVPVPAEVPDGPTPAGTPELPAERAPTR